MLLHQNFGNTLNSAESDSIEKVHFVGWQVLKVYLECRDRRILDFLWCEKCFSRVGCGIVKELKLKAEIYEKEIYLVRTFQKKVIIRKYIEAGRSEELFGKLFGK